MEETPIKTLPKTKLWSENYAVLMADPVTRASVYFSSGRWVEEPSLWREVIGIGLPDGRVLFAKNYGRNHAPTDSGEGAKGGGASLARFEPSGSGGVLRLRFSGPVQVSTREALATDGVREGPRGQCTLDVAFEPTTPIWDMSGASHAAQSVAGAGHIEQIGKANGNVTHQGHTFPITNGYTVRDHSRGPRDVVHYKRHYWANGTFPGGRSFFTYGMQTQGSEQVGMQNAMVCQDSKVYPARVVETDILEDMQDWKRPHFLVLESELGRMDIRATEVLTWITNAMTNPYDMSIGRIKGPGAAALEDRCVRLAWGDKHGLGWSERGSIPEGGWVLEPA